MIKQFSPKAFYLLILIIFLSSATIQENEAKITYLNNCGFMYENVNTKVLIDPFGNMFGDFFYLTSNNTINNIIEGKTPFDNVNLLLITHIHGDHFNYSLAEKFLLRNNIAKMICPPQVYNQMKDSCKNFALIKSRIISPQIAINKSRKLTENNIPLTIIRMQHGTNRSLKHVKHSNYTEYEKTENFGYVIHFKDKNIFHQGDACLKISEKALKNIKDSVNVAHLGYFDWDSVSFNIVRNKLKANKVIFMHGTKLGKELQEEQFQKITPQLIFFKQEMEKISL